MGLLKNLKRKKPGKKVDAAEAFIAIRGMKKLASGVSLNGHRLAKVDISDEDIVDTSSTGYKKIKKDVEELPQSGQDKIILDGIKKFGKADTPEKRERLAKLYDELSDKYTLYKIKAWEDYINGGFVEVGDADLKEMNECAKKMATITANGGKIVFKFTADSIKANDYCHLGNLYEMVDFKKAAKCYLEAAKLQPIFRNYTLALNALDCAAEYDTAIKLAEKWLKEFPKDSYEFEQININLQLAKQDKECSAPPKEVEPNDFIPLKQKSP